MLQNVIRPVNQHSFRFPGKVGNCKSAADAWHELPDLKCLFSKAQNRHRLILQNTQPEKFGGIICCTVTVLFFAAPLTMLLHVIRVKNSDSLPFPMILTSFFVCLQWFIYGVIIQDTFIQIPNFLGCILTVLQLTLFLIYPGKSLSGPSYKLLDTSVTMS